MALRIQREYDTSMRSRAVQEELDEIPGIQQSVVNFEWNESFKRVLCEKKLDHVHAEKLFLGFEDVGGIFAQAAFVDANSTAIEIGSITLSQADSTKENCSTSRVFSIRGIHDCSALVIIARSLIPPEISLEWTETIFEKISADRVFTFASILSLSYQTDVFGAEDTVVLRKLTTSTNMTCPEAQVPTLESPRMISGVCAAVITLCQLRHIKATSYLSVRCSTGVSCFEAATAFFPLAKVAPETFGETDNVKALIKKMTASIQQGIEQQLYT